MARRTTSAAAQSTTCAARTSGPTARCWRVWLDLGELEDSLQSPAGLQRAPVTLAAGADRAPLRRRRARRLPAAAARRHLVRPCARARGHRAAQPGRHAHRLRPDAQHPPARRLPHGLPRPRRAGGAHALAEGHALLMAAINDEPFDVTAAVPRVRESSTTATWGPAPRPSSPPPPTAASRTSA